MVARARAGDRVKVRYSGTSQDGTLIGTRRAPQVLEFTVGSDDVMPGIDKAVLGMAQGEQKKMTLQPADGYGTVEKKKIKSMLITKSKKIMPLKQPLPWVTRNNMVCNLVLDSTKRTF